MRGGHDLIQELHPPGFAVVDIMHNNLVTAGFQVNPPGRGKLAGKILHMGAALIVERLFGIGDDPVGADCVGGAGAPVKREPAEQEH